MVAHTQTLKSISHPGPLCPLAETACSLFAPNKRLVIISLAIKLNHIPEKGNVAIPFFFFQWERRMHFWKSKHTITTGNMTIAALWQETFMFCLTKTVTISQSPVTSIPLTQNRTILRSDCFGDVEQRCPHLPAAASFLSQCHTGTCDLLRTGPESLWCVHSIWAGVGSHCLTGVDRGVEGSTWGTFGQMGVRPTGATWHCPSAWLWSLRVWAGRGPLSVTGDVTG